MNGEEEQCEKNENYLGKKLLAQLKDRESKLL